MLGALHSYFPPQTAHHQLHCFFFLLLTPCRIETQQRAVLQGETAAMRANFRQRHSYPSTDWRNDPPQKSVRFRQIFLHKAQTTSNFFCRHFLVGFCVFSRASILVISLFLCILFLNSSQLSSLVAKKPFPHQLGTHIMSRIFTFLFFSTRGILRIHSCSGNLCFQRFFVFIVSHFDMVRFIWLNAITSWGPDPCSELSLDSRAYCSLHTRFAAVENCSQYWFLWISFLCSKRN